MMKKNRLYFVMSVWAVVGLACQGSLFATETPLPTDTATVTSTATNTPTVTPTFTPESTATPTFTATPEFAVPMGDVETAEDGSYSFRRVLGFSVDMNDSQTIMYFRGWLNFMLFMHTAENPSNKTEEDLLDDFLENNRETDNKLTAYSEYYTYVIDGIEGVAVDVMGFAFEQPMTGRVVIVEYVEGTYFFAYAFGVDTDVGDSWELEGELMFDTVMSTVEFLEADRSEDGLASGNECTVTTDSTYGHTPENAIRVGGGPFDGPGRERAYLDTLLGPNGETLSYDRQGSEGFGDTILDIYVVTYAGLEGSIILYIDEYTFEPLYAPVGFTCGANEFPFGAP